MEIEKAKKIIVDIFNLIGSPIEDISYVSDDKRGHIFKIKSQEFEKLSTGREDLSRDLVYLLKRIFNKDLQKEDLFKCTIDINESQSKADSKVKARALEAVEEARKLKTDVLLDPMSSYDRMVVHSALSEMSDISTESVGEGKERRIKIKYLSI